MKIDPPGQEIPVNILECLELNECADTIMWPEILMCRSEYDCEDPKIARLKKFACMHSNCIYTGTPWGMGAKYKPRGQSINSYTEYLSTGVMSGDEAAQRAKS